MEYNSNRPDIVIPEYGRNIQKMVEFAMSIEDREERNKAVRAIINVMGQLFPYLRDIEDFNHKLWDHLHIMSDFKLDADSPYPIPQKEQLAERPGKVNYPGGKIRFGHYGKSIQDLIDKASSLEDGQDKDDFTLVIANLMKRQFVVWNKRTVEDKVIKRQLTELSNGKLAVKEGQILAQNIDVPKDHHPRKKGGRKPQKKGGRKYSK